ncbi:MAG: Arsenate reductase glutaredoxin-coupled, partial [uncultured Gemmatimonadetes bacterium]
GSPGIRHQELRGNAQGAPLLQGTPHPHPLRGPQRAPRIGRRAQALRPEVRLRRAAGPRGEALPRAGAARGAPPRGAHPSAAGRRAGAPGHPPAALRQPAGGGVERGAVARMDGGV